MSRIIRGTEARGSLSLITRVDANALATLADVLDPGSTVELTITGQAVPTGARAHLEELAAGGVHVKLCGAPEDHHRWLTALQNSAAGE